MGYFPEHIKETSPCEVIVLRANRNTNNGSNFEADVEVVPPPVRVPHHFIAKAIYGIAFGTNGQANDDWDVNWGVSSDVTQYKILAEPSTRLAPASMALGGPCSPLLIAPTLLPGGASINWAFTPRNGTLTSVEIVLIGDRADPKDVDEHTYADSGYVGVLFRQLSCAATATIGNPGAPQQDTMRLGARRFDLVMHSLSTLTEELTGTAVPVLSRNLYSLHFSLRELFENRELILNAGAKVATLLWAGSGASGDRQYPGVSGPFPGGGLVLPQNTGLLLEAHNQTNATNSVRGNWLLHGYRRPSVRGERA